MNAILKILFVEDSKSDAELIWHELEKNKIAFNNLLVETKEEYLDALKSFNPDIIISDYSLPKFDGMTALLLRNEHLPFIPFLLVTGSINEEVAVECIKSGADDYILKENLSRLVPAINSSIEKSNLTKEKKAAEDELYKSEQRLQKAQSIAHVGNWELDLSTKLVWCSDEALNIYGFDKSRRELPLELVRTIPMPEYKPILDEIFNDMLKYNEVYEVEFKIIRANDRAIRTIFSKAELVVESGSDKVKVIGVIQDITERKNAEEALAFNNLILRTQQESSVEGILIVDENDKIINFNQKFIDFARIPKEIVESGADIPVREYVAKQIVNPKEFLDKVSYLNEYREEVSEDELTFKDGRTYDRYSAPMFGPDKKYYGRVWYFHDITDRKLAEKTIRDSEKKYRNIFENVQDIYYETTIDGIVIDVSPSINSFSRGQYNRAELIGKSMQDYYSNPGDRDNLVKIIMGKGSVSDFEINFKNRDGSVIPCSISANINYDESGIPVKILGTVRDITERKKAEEAIIQERMMLRALIDNLPDTIYVQDQECRKVIANSADVKNSGRSSEAEVLGKTDLELYPGETGRLGYAEDRKIILSGKPIIDLEEEFIQNDGSKRWLLSTKIPLQDASGKVTGLVGIGHDITERKEAEEELFRAKVKAEESDKLKTAFLHNISHEIRTPMNAIVGFSALLGEPDIDKQSRESYIDIIMQSSNHLLSIITDIVDISNIEANIIKTAKNDVNINIILKSLVNQYAPAALKKGIELSVHDGLPDEDAMIVTDKTKLTQVLSNLLSNALKFTEQGSVRIWYSLHDNILDFNIADTGIGISKEHFNKIFERFYQVQNKVSRLYEGTGLGLSISKAYVEHMGGKIGIASEPGKGSTFTVSLPYEKAVNVQLEVSKPHVQEELFFKKKKVILVAEDVESNFKLIKYFLSELNAELIHAINGQDAVDKFFANNNIDLILMDIKMPVMDGYTAVKLIREKNNKIPIIAQTAYADDKNKVIECGCSGFISKPFDKKGLFKVLQEFI